MSCWIVFPANGWVVSDPWESGSVDLELALNNANIAFWPYLVDQEVSSRCLLYDPHWKQSFCDPKEFNRASTITIADFYTFELLLDTEHDTSSSSSLLVFMWPSWSSSHVSCRTMFQLFLLSDWAQSSSSLFLFPSCIGIHTLEMVGLLFLILKGS